MRPLGFGVESGPEPGEAVPSPAQIRDIRTADDDTFRLVTDLMSGCGMRNGEALAVNINTIVADDVHRITEHVNQTTKTYAPLKHRKAGDYRDIPLLTRIRNSVESYTDTYGTVDGYLLRHPRDLSRPMPNRHIANQWKQIKNNRLVQIPQGMAVYGLRHFFASNCLSHNLPITDVAEWMGHRNIDITFKIYRHPMPGSIGRAAQVLDLGLAA
ncbi:tyrosine-type recombinase/integrase [Kitasatospora purpeofusca]|uniref:tyrosine-type recombinase/integrase n=1 Tax=Kitasatospora purpeofusca TaxID=67352 RepID=UPI0036560947